MENIDAKFLKTPAQSSDLNPIENTFHLVKKSLDNQALANNITSGTFIEFSARVLKSMKNLSTETESIELSQAYQIEWML